MIDLEQLPTATADAFEEAARASIPEVLAALREGRPTVKIYTAVVWVAAGLAGEQLSLSDVADRYPTYVELAEAAAVVLGG